MIINIQYFKYVSKKRMKHKQCCRIATAMLKYMLFIGIEYAAYKKDTASRKPVKHVSL
jgi:hypothetical protein